MNDGILADMMAELDAELARAEASLPQHPEHTRQTEVMRALALGLGNFERMRAHDVHLLAARLSSGRSGEKSERSDQAGTIRAVA